MYTGSEVAMAQLSTPPSEYLPNLNPPHFHVLVLPFALLSQKSAAILWEVFIIVSLVWSLYLIIQETPTRITLWRCWVLAVSILSFVATQVTLLLGQVSFLIFLVFTLAWIRARQERWTAAGGYLGLALSVKPFLLIFMPYLVLRRQWRSLAAVMGSAFLCFGVGILTFGVDAYISWLQRLATVNWVWHALNASVLGFLTRVFQETAIYIPFIAAPELIRPLWMMTAILIGGVTLLAAAADDSLAATDRGFALLILAALLISPLGWGYYLWLPVGPFAALIPVWWKDRTDATRSAETVVRSRNLLCLLALPGLAWPFLCVTWFQPSPWATVSLGSVYFWSTFLLWLALLADWRTMGGTFFGALTKITKGQI